MTPEPIEAPEPDCDLCGGTGWITYVSYQAGDAYDIPCPEGCPAVYAMDDEEVPF